MAEDDVDYAVPADVPSSRTRVAEPGATGVLWGGRPRTLLIGGCWGLALVLLLCLLVPLAIPDETGADSPEDAVAELLQGIADLDAVAIVSVVAPEEIDDPERARAAYDRLSGRLTRRGEVPPADVTAVLAIVEGQVGGSGDLTSVATLAAVDLDLTDLDLRTEPDPSGRGTRVYIDDGVLDVTLDPDRLPDGAGGADLGRASYEMPLAEGWRSSGRPIEAYLVAVERDGRWYVGLEATGASLDGDA